MSDIPYAIKANEMIGANPGFQVLTFSGKWPDWHFLKEDVIAWIRVGDHSIALTPTGSKEGGYVLHPCGCVTKDELYFADSALAAHFWHRSIPHES